MKELLTKNAIIRLILKYAALLLGGVFVGWFALSLVYMLPKDMIRGNVERSHKYFPTQVVEREFVSGLELTYVDCYTDFLMLNMAMCEGEGNAFWQSLQNMQYGDRDGDGYTYFHEYLAGGEGMMDGYPRYWHGYMLWLKPLLLFFDYGEIRFILFALQSAVGIYIIYLLSANKEKCGLQSYIPVVLLGILLLSPITCAFTFEFASMYSIVLGMLAYVLYSFKKGKRLKNFGTSFFVCGMLVAYFDFLTFPLVAVGLSLLLLVVLFQDTCSSKEMVWTLIRNACGWFVGYVGMWGCKWVLASIVLGQNVLGDAAGSLLFRTSASDVTGFEAVSRVEAVLLNVQAYLHPVALTLIGGVCVYMLVQWIRHRKQFCLQISKTWYVLIIGIIPLAWLALKANHSYIHHWMTHRELVTSIVAFFVFVQLQFRKSAETDELVMKHEA